VVFSVIFFKGIIKAGRRKVSWDARKGGIVWILILEGYRLKKMRMKEH
jgi:hypothetical protein